MQRVRYKPLCLTQKTFGIDNIGNEEMFVYVGLFVDVMYVKFCVYLGRVGVVGEQSTVRVEHFDSVS